MIRICKAGSLRFPGCLSLKMSLHKQIRASNFFWRDSLWSAWKSSSDRRKFTKSMKIILWSLFSLNNSYLILVEGRKNYTNKIERPLIVYKIVFLHKDGSCGRPCGLPFRVGHRVCPVHLGLVPLHHCSHLFKSYMSKVWKYIFF